ncbi:MAG: hypothetical protein AB7K09_10870 [Planctomycetota bacterium]
MGLRHRLILAFALAPLPMLLVAAVGCGSAPEPSPVPEIEGHLARGQQQVDAHQFRRARDEYARALVQSETADNLYGQAVCYLSLSQCHRQLGESREALRMFAEAERLMSLVSTEQPNLRPKDLHSLYGRFFEMQAWIYMSRRQWDDARNSLDLADEHYRLAQ